MVVLGMVWGDVFTKHAGASQEGYSFLSLLHKLEWMVGVGVGFTR